MPWALYSWGRSPWCLSLGYSWHGQFEEEKVLCTFFSSCICTVYSAYLIHCKAGGITCKTYWYGLFEMKNQKTYLGRLGLFSLVAARIGTWMRHVQSGKCDLPVISTFPFAFHTSFMLQVVVVDWYGRFQIQMFTRSDSVVVWFYSLSPGRSG